MIFDFQRLGPDHHRTISQHNHMDEDEEGCKNGHDCACEAENLETRHVWNTVEYEIHMNTRHVWNTVEYETHMNTPKWKFMEIRPWDWC